MLSNLQHISHTYMLIIHELTWLFAFTGHFLCLKRNRFFDIFPMILIQHLYSS